MSPLRVCTINSCYQLPRVITVVACMLVWLHLQLKATAARRKSVGEAAVSSCRIPQAPAPVGSSSANTHATTCYYSG